MADPISAAVTAIISVGAKAGFALGLSKGAAIAASTFVVKTIGYAALSMTASALAAPSIDGYGGSPSEWRADPDAGLPFVVGEFGLAGNVIYPSDGYGADNRFTSIVTVFHCNGPVHQWGAYTLDDVSATFSGGVLTSGPSLWRGNIYLDRRDGYSTDTALASPSGLEGGASVPGWGSAYRLPGMACSMLTLRGDKKNKRFPTGEPSPFQVLKAPKWSYDPRLDDTYPGGEGPHRRNDRSTWSYSHDPYILALNFALGYWTGTGLGDGVLIGGFGNDWDNVDVAAFVAGANISEANGWKVGGMFRSTDDKHQVMSAFLQAGGGVYANPAGKISCVCRGAPKTSVATVTYEDLAGDIEIATDAPASEKVNSVIPRCPLPSFKYEMTALNEVSVSEYATLDRGKRQRRVDMPFVPATQQGSQLAAYAIVNSREPISGRVPLQPWMGELSPGDCFDFALPGLDLDGVKVMVLDREWNPGRQVWTVTFQSETDAKHAFALGLDPTPPAPDGLTPGSAFTVPVPDGSEWTASGGVVGTPGGPQQPGIIIEGGSEPNMIDGVWIEYALDDEGSPGSWVTWWKGEPSAANYVITGLDAGQTYWLGIRYRNTYGVWSDVEDRLILGPFETGALVATSAGGLGGRIASDVLASLDAREIEAARTARALVEAVLAFNDRIGRRRTEILEARQESYTAVTTEQDERIAADEAEASTRTSQIATINGNLAAHLIQILTNASNHSAFVSTTNSQFSAVGDAIASNEDNITTVSDGLSALTSSTSIQFSAFGDAIASNEDSITTVSDGLSALTSSTSIQFSAFGDAIASNEDNITTVSDGLSALTSSTSLQFSAVGDSIAAIEGEQTTLASALAAEVSNRTTAVAAVAGNLAALQSDYTLTADEVSSLGTSFTSLSATVTSQGDELTAVGSDLTTVQASVAGLLATRLQTVSAGDGWAGILMAAADEGGFAASVIRFAAQAFQFGIDFDTPFFTIDAIGGELYTQSAAGHKTFQVTADGRVRLRDPDTGEVTWDTDLGGATEAGIPSRFFPQFGNIASANNVATNGWTTVVQSTINDMLDAGTITGSGRFFITTPSAVSGNAWRLQLSAPGETTLTIYDGFYQTIAVTGGDFEGLVDFSKPVAVPFGGDVTLSLQVFGPTGGSVSGRLQLIRT